MVCPNCGNTIADGSYNCPYCGATVAQQPQQTTYQYQQTGSSDAPGTTKIMVLGIVAACLAWWPFASIAGIIMGAINRKNVDAYIASGAPASGKVKAGSITSKVGLIAGIIMTVFWTLYVCVIACAVTMAL